MGKTALYKRVDVDGRCALTTAGSHRNGSHLWQSFRALRFMLDEIFIKYAREPFITSRLPSIFLKTFLRSVKTWAE